MCKVCAATVIVAKEDRHPFHVLNHNSRERIEVAKLLRILEKIDLAMMWPKDDNSVVHVPIELVSQILEQRDNLLRHPDLAKANTTEKMIQEAADAEKGQKP
jgi:gamma-glutamyltranspeptidase